MIDIQALKDFLAACEETGILDVHAAARARSFLYAWSDQQKAALSRTPSSTAPQKDNAHNVAQTDAYQPLLFEQRLDPNQSFENLYPCKSNHFPQELARMVVTKRAANSGYNPLYFFGRFGLGKTHLLCAIANAIKTSQQVVLVDGSDLSLELERAAQHDQRAALRHWLSSIEVLLIDEVHNCIGEAAAQEELLIVLNHRTRAGLATVLAAEVPPARLKGADARLISRLGSGIVVELNMPERTEREEILRQFIKGRTVPYEVIGYLATQVDDNLRHLRTVANQLLAMGDQGTVEINIDLARALVPLPRDLDHEHGPLTTPASTSGATALRERSATLSSARFKEMLASAESPEEQALALQIALGERLRQLKDLGGEPKTIDELEHALELLREGKTEEAMKCIGL